MVEFAGGCLCGAVRYTATAEPVSVGVCHCRDCQKFTGSAFGALAGFLKTAVTFVGTMKTYSSPGGSGMPILRHFCGECGSSVAEEAGPVPHLVILNVGTLDDPKSLAPRRETFRDDALPWVHVGGDIPRFARKAV